MVTRLNKPLAISQLTDILFFVQQLLLRYLFGALYENFKLLWDPLVELVQSYAKTMKTASFWDIFSKQLADLSDSIGKWWAFG